MSSRERWTIYPLLFLAILMAARNDVLPTERSRFRTIECQELIVSNLNNEPLVKIGETSQEAGVVVVYAPVANHMSKSLDEADASDHGGASSPARSSRKVRTPVAELTGEADGGAMRLRSVSGIPTLYLGHQRSKRLSGLMATRSGDDWLTTVPVVASNYWGTQFDWNAVTGSREEIQETVSAQ